MSKPNLVVYYHSPCHDGFLGQLVISRLLSDYANVVTVPLGHGPKRSWDTSIFTNPQTTVFFVDIAPHPAMLDELIAVENISEIQVWDHHIDFRTMYGDAVWNEVPLTNYFNVTLQTAAPHPKVKFHFCNDISGSRLAPIAAGHWVHDNPWAVLQCKGADEFEVIAAQEAAAIMYNHPIIQHASDYDTWQKKLPHTDAVFAYYRNYNYADIGKWHELLNRITSFDTAGYRNLVQKGEAMIEAIETLAEKLCAGETPRPTVLSVPNENGDEVLYQGVICNAYGLLANDVGEIMRTKYNYDFAIMFNVEPNTIALSIRTKPGVPANSIAKLWGGGGHAGSAGAGISGDARIAWLNQYVFV